MPACSWAKKLPRTAEAHSDFVADQMHAIGVAECAHTLQILRVMHRHARCTLNERFDDDGGNFAVTCDEQLFQRIGGTIGNADGAFAGSARRASGEGARCTWSLRTSGA